MKFLVVLCGLFCLSFVGCGQDNNTDVSDGADHLASIIVNEKGEEYMYQQITAEEAKGIMDSGEGFVLLDVREQSQFDEGHIPGAVLIPYTEIENKAEAVLTKKDAQILVYCRSGRRSKIAAESLAKLGYTNVKEFGGINDWPYEIEK